MIETISADKISRFFYRGVLILFMLIILSSAVFCQFRSNYKLLKGYGQHLYFEAYDLPVLGIGPTDLACAADGKSLFFSARGWLWQLDFKTFKARQITSGAAADFQPALSPDGKLLAFTRDNARTTEIVLLDLEKGKEKVLVHSAAIDKDPQFAFDGQCVFYSSSEAGDMDIWKIDVASGQKTRLTSDVGLEMRPLPLPDGKRLIYVSKTRPGKDAICVLDVQSKEIKILKMGSIISQLQPSLSPNGKFVVFNWPDENDKQFYQLWIMDLDMPETLFRVVKKLTLPLNPVWSKDSRHIYFVEADENQEFILKKVPSAGGLVEDIHVRSWDWALPTARIAIKTVSAKTGELLPARLNVLTAAGHPLFPAKTMPRFDSQNGMYYFHSNGRVEIEAPLGKVTIKAAKGFDYEVSETTVALTAGSMATAEIKLKQLWQPRANGFYAGDNHLHLNYGGPYHLRPDVMVAIMQAEDVDFAVPMTANLHNRYMDEEWIGWSRKELPAILVGQEVRSHFLSHLGFFGLDEWFNPWFYGPGYPLYGQADISNFDVLNFARQHGGTSIYVHPYVAEKPFAENNLGSFSISIIPDALDKAFDTIEIACLWISNIGASELWYRFLNLGLPIAPSSGSDSFVNFYRNMIFGSAREYVYIEGPFSIEKYTQALKQGRSFSTTGPLIDFKVNGQRPGEVIAGKVKKVGWSLGLFSAVAVEKVELIVNGKIVYSAKGLRQPGKKFYRGHLVLPDNGWIAVRVYGGKPVWPMMHSLPFAHSAPLWIGAKGSVDVLAAKASAGELLKALAVAEARVLKAYEGSPIPKLRARFTHARSILEKILATGEND